VIRINKPQTSPEILNSLGIAEQKRLCEDYLADKEAYDSGRKLFSFKKGIFRHSEVVDQLRRAQHNKCCYCEGKERRLDVEHFRPKGGYRQSQSEPGELPGYYWLAYDWDNLFLACVHCNQDLKRTVFPLADPAHRARSHADDISNEAPLLIDPSRDDPEKHIQFLRASAVPKNDSARGSCTIMTFDLKDIELRRDWFRYLQYVAQSLNNLTRLQRDRPLTPEEQDELAEGAAILEESVADSAPYAAMARCAAKANWYPNA
jgi:uncharacterized protein (TIGR02646 family)